MPFTALLGDLLVRLTGDSSSFEKMLDQAETKMAASGKRISKLGKQLSISVTAPLVAIGAVSVKAFSDFDSAITKSLAIMGDVSAELRQELEDTALILSTTSVTSAEDLAEAYFFLASAGLDAKQSIAALGAVQSFAAAGAFDMATATDLLTDAQTALGLSSKNAAQNLANMTRVSDVLIKANTLANASAEQFAKALTTKAAAALRALNKDLEEGVAVLAVFADQGLKGAAAGERLSIVLRDLQSASQKNTEVWKALGLQVFDAQGKMLPLADIVQQLEKTFAPLSDEQKKAAATMLGFQEESFDAIKMLIGMSDKIREYERELRKAAGITDEVAKKQLKAFSAQMQILRNNLTVVAIGIGKELVPAIKLVAAEIQKFIVFWRSLSVEARRFVIILGGVLASIGPVLIALGFMFKAVAALIVAWNALTLAMLRNIAAATLLAVAFVLVTDAILQMTDTGNLGVLDLINNFRIAGARIATWMQVAALLSMKAWAFATNRIMQGIVAIDGAFKQLGGRVIILFTKAIRFAVVETIKKIQVALGFVGLFFGDQFKAAIDAVNDNFEKGVNDVTNKMLEEYTSTYAKLTKLDEEFKKKAAEFDTTIAETFAKDERDLLGKKEQEEKKKTEDKKKAEDPDLTSIPGVIAAKADAQFRQVSLRRFALEGPGGIAGGTQKKQEVKDKDANMTLKDILNTLKSKNTVATLG